MHLKRNIIMTALGVLVVCAALCGLYYYMVVRIDTSAIDYIKTMQKGANNFTDLAGDIGVSSIDDLGFEVKGDYDIVIHYGKQVIRCNKNCMESPEWRRKAKSIGLEVLTHVVEETGEILYRVTYWGEPIEQWSLVT